MADLHPQFLTVGSGVAERRIAYIAEPGGDNRAGVVWLPGLKSEMTSTKASALAQWAAQHGIGCTRFDYSGHGQSGGRFEDGTIGQWLEEALAVFSHLTRGPQILVGSSMGGYIALLLLRSLMRQRSSDSSHNLPSPAVPKARVPRDVGEGQGGGDAARASTTGSPPTPNLSPPGGGGGNQFHCERISALVLIAPAWDMTERLMWARFPESVRREILDQGVYLRPSKYEDGPYAITRGLIEEGRAHLIGDAPFDPGRPVHILHGLQDPDVPWEHTLDLVAHLSGNWTHVSAVPDGDHRLSRPQDLELLISVLGTLTQSELR